MAIVFDRDFGRVWSDGTTPFIFSSIVRVPQLQELEELADKQIQVIRELKNAFGDVYSILDLRLCPAASSEIVQYYFTKIIPRQIKAGIKHKAFVAPEEKKSLEIFITALAAMDSPSVSMHVSFEEALNKVNQKRTQPKATVQHKSVFNFFANLVR